MGVVVVDERLAFPGMVSLDKVFTHSTGRVQPMQIKAGDHVIVTTLPSGRVEGASVNWEQADTIGVTYDTGGGNVLPVLPHADNAEIYSVALCKGCKTCYTNNRRSK